MAKILLNTRPDDFWKEQTDLIRRRIDPDALFAPDISTVRHEELKDVRGLITYGLDSAVLPYLTSLQIVGIPMAGINTLPVPQLRERGVMIINAHANGRYVAERALALLLAAAGKIVSGDKNLRQGRWHGFAAGEPAELSWRPVSEMTVVVVGTGSIGQWTARYLKPFGSRIIGVRRRTGSDGIPDGLFDEITTDLDDACQRADALIVTLPSTPDTVGLIGDAHFHALEGGILVNVGRGDVLDERALYRACGAGRITAAIDTWFSYPDPPGSRCMPSRYPLEQLDNVVLSPHLGGYTLPATTASGREIVERFIDWADRGMPATMENTVDLEAGY